MHHEDNSVRLNAAASCLSLNVNIVDAKNIEANFKNKFKSTISLEAEMTWSVLKNVNQNKYKEKFKIILGLICI